MRTDDTKQIGEIWEKDVAPKGPGYTGTLGERLAEQERHMDEVLRELNKSVAED